MTLAQPLQPRSTPMPPPKIRNVVAIGSGKGGVGKTWFAITLAQALGMARQRVLLFDADLGLANAHIQLGFMPQRDLGTVIAGRRPLTQAINPVADTGFDLIAGRSGAGSLANMPGNRLSSLRGDLMGLARDYDWLLLDLGAGVERSVRMIAAQAATTLVMTNAEPTSLTDAYAFIKMTAAADPDADLRVVVNAADSPKDGTITYQTLLNACQNFLNYAPRLAGVIRRDKRVPDAIRAQTPLLNKHPAAKAGQDVKAIAAGLLKG